MRVVKGLPLAIIFLFYASFLCGQEPYAITTISPPGAVSTFVNLLSGNNIWGSYQDTSFNNHGFLYNISTKTYTTIDYPGAVSTSMLQLSGNNFLGWYQDAQSNYHGFLYNISNSTYTTFDVPGATTNGFMQMVFSGNNIWGVYFDVNRNLQSFLATSTGVNPPLITSLSPTSGTIGATVAIKGSSFGSSQGPSTVSFNGTSVTTYISWSTTVIKCDVPAGATTGPVTVTTTDGVSNGKNFTVSP